MSHTWDLIKADFRIDRGAIKRAAKAADYESVEEFLEFTQQDSGMNFELDDKGNVVGTTLEEDIDYPREFEEVCEQLAPYVRKGSLIELNIDASGRRIEFDGESCTWIELEEEKVPKRSWFRRLFGKG